MTREEAATWIKEHVMWGEYNKGEYKEALEMAIEALKFSEKYKKAFEDIRAELRRIDATTVFKAWGYDELNRLLDKYDPSKAESEE